VKPYCRLYDRHDSQALDTGIVPSTAAVVDDPFAAYYPPGISTVEASLPQINWPQLPLE
jgi:hypothetical protein